MEKKNGDKNSKSTCFASIMFFFCVFLAFHLLVIKSKFNLQTPSHNLNLFVMKKKLFAQTLRKDNVAVCKREDRILG